MWLTVGASATYGSMRIAVVSISLLHKDFQGRQIDGHTVQQPIRTTVRPGLLSQTTLLRIRCCYAPHGQSPRRVQHDISMLMGNSPTRGKHHGYFVYHISSRSQPPLATSPLANSTPPLSLRVWDLLSGVDCYGAPTRIALRRDPLLPPNTPDIPWSAIIPDLAAGGFQRPSGSMISRI